VYTYSSEVVVSIVINLSFQSGGAVIL
jgi:hypothetical protein